MPDNSGAINLEALPPEEQEAVRALAEERGSVDQNPDDNKRKVLTAFIVLVDYNGNPEVMAFDDPSLLVQNHPTPDLIYAAASTIRKDIQAQETAQHAAQLTVEYQMQQARALSEQMQAQKLAQGLDLPGVRR